MSAAIAPISPDLLCRILKAVGYSVLGDDEFNWAMSRDKSEAPIIIPKKGEVVAVDVLMGALDHAKMDNRTFFTLRDGFLSGSAGPSQAPAIGWRPR